ncbi:MAG TPA: hypothetical protein VJ773_02210 [Gemmatimonadales bacterium]|nr:hypothetical protein [Gemmatimonadales bacterium]
MFEALRSIARRHPTLSRQLQAAYAAAWEALVETHREQALGFIQAMGSVLPADEALDRYFHEVPVPRAMQEPVRAGVLVRLANDSSEVENQEIQGLWQLLAVPRQLARIKEQVRERATLAAARAAEAVAATHLRNALAIEDVIGHVEGAEEAVVQYIRTLDLPGTIAQVVHQQALARLADRELAAERVHAIAAEPVTVRERPLMLVKFLGAGAG